MVNSNNLSRKAVTGVSWGALSVVVIAVSQVVIGAMMARLLTPSDFGLVAISNVVIQFGQHVSQLGLASAVIQKKYLSDDDKQTANIMAIVLGSLMTLLVYLLAPFLVNYMSNPEAEEIVRIMSLSFFFVGLGIVPSALIRRKMKFRYLAYVDVVSYVFPYTIGLIAAYMGGGVYALLIAMLLQIVVRITLFLVSERVSVLRIPSVRSARELITFGGMSTVTSILEFLMGSIDAFFIGKYLGSDNLGKYNRSKMVVDLPIYYVSSSVSRVSFSLLSNLNAAGDTARLRMAFYDLQVVMSIILVPLVVLVSSTSDLIVHVLLGKQWLDAVEVAAIMPFCSYFSLTASIFSSLLTSTGELNKRLFANVFALSFLVMALWSVREADSLLLFSCLLVVGSSILLASYVFMSRAYISIQKFLGVVFKGVLLSIPALITPKVLVFLLPTSWSVFFLLPLIGVVSFLTVFFWFLFGPFGYERKIIMNKIMIHFLDKVPISVAHLIAKILT